MIYREIASPSSLSEVVRCFWYLKSDYSERPKHYEALWPQGNPELIFHYGSDYSLDPRFSRPLNHSIVIGPLTKGIKFHSTGLVEVYGVRFLPHSWNFIFGDAAHVFVDRIIPLEDIWDLQARELEEQAFGTTIESFGMLMQDALLARMSIELEPNRFVPELVSSIEQSGGKTYLSDLIKSLPFSARTVERKFKENVGISPKKLHRITRFNAVRKHLLFNPTADLMDLVFDYNYYDYSHLSKDFKVGLELSPKEFQLFVQEMINPHLGSVEFLQD